MHGPICQDSNVGLAMEESMDRNTSRTPSTELYSVKEFFQMVVIIAVALVFAVFFAWLMTSMS